MPLSTFMDLDISEYGLFNLWVSVSPFPQWHFLPRVIVDRLSN